MIAEQLILKELPIPAAILDSELRFVDCSQIWKNQFKVSEDIKGKSFFSSMPKLPEELQLDLQYGVEGVKQSSCQSKILTDDGDTLWYEWKINTLSAIDGENNGVLLVLEDISERKLEEELLKKSQKVARIGGWEVDLVNNKLYWSKITKEIHEVPQDYIPDIAKGISFYKEGYSRDTITQLVQEGIEKGTTWDVELQLVTAKNKEIWVRAIGEPEMVDGKCVRLVGTFQDIDRRKSAEIGYRKVNERHNIAMDAAKIGIWEFHIGKDELLWSDNMYELYGVDKKDFDGGYHAWESGVLPEDLERTNKEVQDAIAGIKEFDTTFRVRGNDGQVRWLSAQATIIKDKKGNPIKMIGINQDITELKTTKLQLVQSEESLQGAFESSSVGMALGSPEGKFIKVNKSLCKSLGYTEEELLKKRFNEITHPDDLEPNLSLINEIVAGKRNSYEIKKRYFSKSGEIIHAYLTVTAVKKIDGGLSHLMAQVVDITSMVEASNKLKGLLDITTNQNNSLLNFAHIVSHNLRSHTANLSMITSFLLDDQLSEEEHQESLTMLKRAATGLDETITHLNEVVQVKLETGKKMKSVRLHKVVKKVLKDVGALITENKHNIKVNVEEDLQVKGVPAYVESIILNLITNALKYRDPKRAGEIKIVAQDKQNRVVLCVSDNGLGIDLDKYGAKLFGMYKTFHNNKDARGIGLFITKNQIESMGGKISVESEINVGTTFKVEFLKA